MLRFLSRVVGGLVLGVLLALTACSGFVEAEKTGLLPMTGDFPGLVQLGKNKIFTKADDRMMYLGTRGQVMEQFGTRSLYVGDYTLGGKGNDLSLESYQVDGDVGAAGIFYYYKGRLLANAGKDVDVGGAGVIDTKNDSRNLYFYKGQLFFALIYTGKAPIPDLVPLARWLADKVNNRNWQPTGFKYLKDLDGVSQKYTRISYGNALNMDFLPPAVMSLALCAGTKAKVYACTFSDPKQMQNTEDAFVRFLRFDTKQYKESKLKSGASSYRVYQGIEKDEGLIQFVRGRDVLFIVTGADSAGQGLDLLQRLLDREGVMRSR